MSERAKSKGRRRAAGEGQLWLRLPGLVREALYETVIGAGLACVDEVLEAERVALCGSRYEHSADRQARRGGHVASSLVLIGRRVKHWQRGTMVLRWTAAGVLEAERGFRKLAGYRAMPTLVAALRTHSTELNSAKRGVD
jgi:hypothetical protein